MDTAQLDPSNDLASKIEKLSPWHMDVRVTEQLSTGVAKDKAQVLPGQKVSMINPQKRFNNILSKIYRSGLQSKRFLDCACNAGGYCFWACDLGADAAFGFDVREHWIDQAKFLQENCSVYPANRTEFKVLDLYDLPKQGLPKFDITMFKGIFYHLPDPITGLKIAADMTNEVLWFNSQTLWNVTDGSLQLGLESPEHVMSGVHRLKWYPTGPGVIIDILKWLGFTEIKLLCYFQNEELPQLGRVEMLASKVDGLLKNVGENASKYRSSRMIKSKN